MDNGQLGDYSLWVQLANDPSQSEQARLYYRALMQEHLHQQLRDAFRMASQRTQSSKGAPRG
jgi:hypothetical protein